MLEQALAYFAGLDIWGWLEILAMVVGIYYVYLEIRKTRLLWYVCILTSILNIFVYWHNNFLSMTVIQVYYIVMAFYGIHAFKEIKEEAIAEYGEEKNPTGQKVAIRRFDWKTGAWTLGIAVPAFFALAHILRVYAEANGITNCDVRLLHHHVLLRHPQLAPQRGVCRLIMSDYLIIFVG